MDKQNFEAVEGQLDRILAFFPRVESKATFLFAFNGAVMALMAINVGRGDFFIWYIALPGLIAAILVSLSVYFVYRCIFPDLYGGSSSLFYFREIAKRTEAGFIEEFENQEPDKLKRDLLGQVWRNSEILEAKFDAIKIAFVLSAIGIIPAAIYLAAVALTHSAGLTLR